MADEINVTISENDLITVTLEGVNVTDHSMLSNLDFDHSGHTGFQKKIVFDDDYKTFLIEE